MEKTYSSSAVGVVQHCSVKSLAGPSVLKALREMADRNHGRAVSDATEPTRNSAASNKQEQREQDDVSRSTNRSAMFHPSVPFSPMGSAEEQRNEHVAAPVSFNDAIPSPVFQGVNAASSGLEEEQQPVDAMEARIRSEIEALSVTEQQQVENDVQGKNPSHHHASLGHTAPGEPQRLTAMELESLDREFQQLVQTHRDYRDLVPALDYDYVKDPQLRLKMLRAENYDVGAAALRLANFLKFLQEIFGPYLLMRPIQLVDLSPEERQLQRKGLQQLFKFRDQTGRRIMGCFDVHFPPTLAFESQVGFELQLIIALKCKPR